MQVKPFLRNRSLFLRRVSDRRRRRLVKGVLIQRRNWAEDELREVKQARGQDLRLPRAEPVINTTSSEIQSSSRRRRSCHEGVDDETVLEIIIMSSLIQFEAAALLLGRCCLDRGDYKGLGGVTNSGGGVHQWRILWRRSLFGGVR